MNLDPHIVLNEEMTPPPKYESYSSGLKNISDTLDEPVLDTIVFNTLPRKEMSWKYTIRLASLCEEKEITKKSSSNGISGAL